ncbi:hypothetical protein MAPG_06509 [Magnaporthiopsis poae ATCC 64411]|uniref:Zn(2)-C6 fungal-type domain-containing protein n=1 Tax=Magnaporthiopsis poae (strain ATCC 64411 / 73-15) TaxID=644358 RepID=A0A0C4E280_MAGP6|nr:hypothetical protein MAPG_06509 [Magnaporthiopsis poae ATCC 64411]
MVGVPRSSGCGLCLRRRVKCDEARPACANCSKYGQPCPGYEKPIKFVAGKHAVRPRRSRQQRVQMSQVPFGNRHQDGTVSAEAGPSSDGDGGDHLVSLLTSEHVRRHLELQAVAVFPDLGVNRAQFVSTLIDSISRDQSAAEVAFFRPWFRLVPERLGTKATLDSAMCALTLHLLGKSKADGRLISQSRMLYGQSIQALQQALNHPSEWRTAETLCTATLLCFYELFAGTTSHAAWMAHAQGVSRVIQLRGPDAYMTDRFDKMLLLAFRAIIIMNAMFSLQDCFLAQKPWQKVLQHVSADLEIQTIPPEFVPAIDAYFRNLVMIPSFVRRLITMRIAKDHGVPHGPAQVAALRRDAEEQLLKERAWYASIKNTLLPPPREVPSRDPTSPFATVLRHENQWAGSIQMNHWANTLILQGTINECGGHAEDFRPLNRVFADNIFRSVELVGQGLMGPLRCSYPLRIAYEFSTLDIRRWIGRVVSGFEPRYAATSVKDYPEAIQERFA